MERIQGGDLHAVAEPFATLLEPVAVGLSGASGHEVEQSCSGLAVGVGGQVDHAGQLLGATATVLNGLDRHVVPHVHPEPGHPGEPRLVIGHRL